MKPSSISLVGLLGVGGLACGEGGDLALSAGAPVSAAVGGTITKCGMPVPEAEVALLVHQAAPEQARPVDTQIGPVTTDRHGEYVAEVAPAFAVPGPASVRLRVTEPGGPTREAPGGTVEFRLGRPARDTVRVDADLGVLAGRCPA